MGRGGGWVGDMCFCVYACACACMCVWVSVRRDRISLGRRRWADGQVGRWVDRCAGEEARWCGRLTFDPRTAATLLRGPVVGSKK